MVKQKIPRGKRQPGRPRAANPLYYVAFRAALGTLHNLDRFARRTATTRSQLLRQLVEREFGR